MIPKIIHYCWLSGEEYPTLVKNCIDSWKKHLPDYQFICWDTSKFDINICPYTKEAFKHKKYAFVSDYVRLYALYQMGGVYLDSDIEVLKSFDSLLNNKAFTGFENKYSVAAWLLASEKENPLFKEFLSHYDDLHFEREDGTIDMTPNPYPITRQLLEHGLELNNELQKLDYITVYPIDYFGAYDSVTRELHTTDNSYAFHYYNGAWMSDEDKAHKKNRADVRKKYGKMAGDFYEAGYQLKTKGIKELITTVSHVMKKY